jgi:hypothetical protein
MARRTLGSLLRRPYGALEARAYGGLADRGFSEIRPAHSSVVRHIAASGSRLTDLAARAGMTKQSMAYLVESLARDGFLSVGPDPLDGRAKLVRSRPGGGGSGMPSPLSVRRQKGSLRGEWATRALPSYANFWRNWRPSPT